MNEIIHGDCLEVMRKMESNSISAIITDPPYGLKFMGKDWDKGIPGVPFWTEMLRICKPGSFLLAFGGTRTFHRLTCAIEDAGWEIRDCLMWLYGSGFPKSHNNFGLEGYGTALKPSWEPIIMAMKPCDGTFKQNAEKWGQAGIHIDECRIETSDNYSYPNGKGGSHFFKGLNTEHTPKSDPKGRWPSNLILDEEAGEILDEQSGILKSGGGDKGNKTQDGGYGKKFGYIASHAFPSKGGASRFFYCAKASSSERNRGCEGFWFDNLELVLHNGTSFELEELWVREGQSLNTNSDLEASQEKDMSEDSIQYLEDKECCTIWFGNENEEQFPKTIKYITSMGLKQTIEFKTLSYYRLLNTNECIQDVIKMNSVNGLSLVENVGLHKILKIIFTKEKMASLLGVKNAAKRTPCLISVKEELKRKNFHSTVKPLSLMEYLIKLIMPPNDGILLDPFAGSGSTLLAAKNLSINAIGIEIQSDYVEIANARIA
jgi:site-specific DNA-methyltransferase (adenine-specific)